jgi:hypothetical protein
MRAGSHGRHRGLADVNGPRIAEFLEPDRVTLYRLIAKQPRAARS